LDRYEEARRLYEQGESILRRALGDQHPRTLNARSTSATLLIIEGHPLEASRLLEEILLIQKRVLGTQHPKSLACTTKLAEAYFEQGRETDAIKMLEEVLSTQRRVLGPQHNGTLSSIALLSTYLVGASNQNDRDPRRAIDLAEEMVRGAPQYELSW